MEEKLSLVITLPESLAGLPIRFEVNSGCRNIALNLESSTPIKKKYLLIWNQTDYLKVDDEDILWIKADGSYSCIHFRDGNKMMVSINLANIMKDLPTEKFMRTVNPQTNQKEAVNVSFQFMQDGRMVQLNVPLLTIVPIPYIAIQNVDINFKANISASSSSVQESSSSQSIDAGADIKAKAGWGPFSVEANMKANYSSKKDSKATQDSRYSVEYTMDVAVKAGQDSMPAGLAKVLELLGSAMDVSNPKGTLEVNARKLTLDPNGNATLIVTYKNCNGLFESEKVKVTDGNGNPCNATETNAESAVFELKAIGDYTVEVTDNADKKLNVKVEQ